MKGDNMTNEIYVYPAIFTYEGEDISISFPDIPEALSCAKNDLEAVKNAKEVLSLSISSREDDNDIPEPTPISKIVLESNQIICMIDVWMPYYRALIKTAYVKKTLTIPNWLNVIAEHNKFNFSKILQSYLKERLGIT